MEERYRRINIVSPKNQIIGCPIEIDKYAILLDNECGDCVLQLKFRCLNIGENERIWINSVKVKIHCFDDAGEPVEENDAIEYTYSNLNAHSFFGTETAISLQSSCVKTVDVEISRVVYHGTDTEDKVWRYDGREYVVPLKQEEIPTPLAKQLCREGMDDSFDRYYYPIENGGMWQCACGRVNDGNICVRCRAEKESIFKCANIEKLEKDLLDYTAEQKNLEEIQKTRDKEEIKDMIRDSAIFGGVLIIIVLISILCN